MIDLYCERVGEGLLAEPLNAATNVLFLVAAAGAWRCARGHRDVQMLAMLIAAIAIGSGLFHTFATAWAQWLDVVPIALFQVAFLALYTRRVAAATPLGVTAVLALFVLALAVAARAPAVLNGSLSYAPAALALLALGIHHARTASRRRYRLLFATGVFAASLTARTLDLSLCPVLPFGTHFLWHALNALVLFVATATYADRIFGADPARP